MTRATPEMIAAAWQAWHSRHGGKLGPGPAFVEAINAALDKMPAPPLTLSSAQIELIMRTAERMDASPENVLKRAIGSYCAKFGGDGQRPDPDLTNIVAIPSQRKAQQ